MVAQNAPPQSGLSGEVIKGRIALAEYRSALQPSPDTTTVTFRPTKPGEAKFIVSGTGLVIQGWSFLLQGDTTTLFRLLPPLDGKLAKRIYFEDGIIEGGTQLLDGIHWHNTVFIGTHIRYDGGEVELQNVTFVNCTFDVLPNDRGVQFVDYAALDTPNLTIS